MEITSMNRVRDVLLGLMVMAAIGIGANEAYASRASVVARDCGEWNWCAPSQGGQMNCNRCCDNGELGGFCNTDWEHEYQGCICYAG
jgi:hypothetical protein